MQLKDAMEQKLIEQVRADGLMEYDKNIAQWVRITSLQAEVDSLNYIRGILDSFGYTTSMPFYMGYISYPVNACVTIEAPVEEAYKAIGTCFTPSTAIGGLVAEVVDYSEQSFAGKIVLMDGLAGPERIKNAEAQGAVGVLWVHDQNIHNGPADAIWGNPTVDVLYTLPAIPAAGITRAAGTRMRELIAKGQHVKVRFESTVVNEWRKCPLLIADMKSPKSDKFVMFTGHIDSWDYGAMDNGSANATMIECARILAQQKDAWDRGLRVCFWSGHSQGRYAGSGWYADNHFEEIQNNCVAYVNIDSVGGMNSVVVEEPPVMAQAWDLAKDVIEEQTGLKFKGKRIARNSDESFLGVGLTCIFGTFSEQDIATVGDSLSFRYGENSRAGGLGWWWHTTEDTCDKLDPELLVRDCRIYLVVLWRLLHTPVLPYSITRAVEEMQTTVTKLQAKLENKFDFSPLVARLADVHAKAVAFDAECAACTSFGPESEALVTKQMALCRKIVQVAYHEIDVYSYDLAGSIYPLPNLESGERLARSLEGSSRYYMYLTKLQKGYNRVMGYAKELQNILA